MKRYANSSATLAPWAELVPGAGQMSVNDLTRLPDDGWQYELVHGTLVRMPLSGGEASRIGMRLGGRLTAYVEDRDLGAVTGEAGGSISQRERASCGSSGRDGSRLTFGGQALPAHPRTGWVTCLTVKRSYPASAIPSPISSNKRRL